MLLPFSCIGNDRVHIHSCGELAHGVEILGEVLDHGGDVLGDGGSAGKILAQDLNLVGGGNLRGQQQPEESLGKGLSSTYIQ